MYAASLTKAMFAHLVMQLVDDRVIALDTPIAKYLPKPLPSYEKYADLADDARWERITPRMLLSHTSGLPTGRFFAPDQKLHLQFEPGEQFGYSGEGINLLQFVIEEHTGKAVGDMMQSRVFDRFDMTRTGMVWRPAFASNFAMGYDTAGQLVATWSHTATRSPRSSCSARAPTPSRCFRGCSPGYSATRSRR